MDSQDYRPTEAWAESMRQENANLKAEIVKLKEKIEEQHYEILEQAARNEHYGSGG